MTKAGSDINLRLGTRGSLLARTQSQMVADEIERLHSNVKIELVILKTTGDLIQNRPLHNAGGKGLFVKELEQALLAGEIDFAVHSLKDVPVTMPLVEQGGLVIAGYPKREDARDVLVCKNIRAIGELPPGARVGTGSLRRRAQLLYARPDLKVEGLRGNVDTRISKCLQGQYDAIVLAMAGIRRAGLYDSQTMTPIPVDRFVPAAGQGALALQCRAGDQATREILAEMNDPDTALCVSLERGVVLSLKGDCVSPIGALAEVKGKSVHLTGLVAASGGGLPVISARASGEKKTAEAVLETVLKSLVEQGAEELLHPAS